MRRRRPPAPEEPPAWVRTFDPASWADPDDQELRMAGSGPLPDEARRWHAERRWCARPSTTGIGRIRWPSGAGSRSSSPNCGATGSHCSSSPGSSTSRRRPPSMVQWAAVVCWGGLRSAIVPSPSTWGGWPLGRGGVAVAAPLAGVGRADPSAHAGLLRGGCRSARSAAAAACRSRWASSLAS
jgi:hypothetical protein